MGHIANDTSTGQQRLNALLKEGWAQSERYQDAEYSQLSAGDQMAIDQAYSDLTSPTASPEEKEKTAQALEEENAKNVEADRRRKANYLDVSTPVGATSDAPNGGGETSPAPEAVETHTEDLGQTNE